MLALGDGETAVALHRQLERLSPVLTRADCEIDHVIPWSEGGLTVEDNGRVARGFHN